MNATHSIICFSVAIVQVGCATQAPQPPEIPRQQLANVGVANIQFLPTLNLDEAKGLEVSVALRQCTGVMVPAIVTLACMPFASLSAAQALRAGTSALTPAQAEAHFRERLSTLRPQSALREHLTAYATEQGMAGFRAIEEGPAVREEQYKYRAGSDGPSTVLEVGIMEVAAKTTGVGNIPYFFTVTAQGRLVRTSDNAVLDSFAHTQATPAHSADAWMADNGKALARELDRAYRRLAEAFVDEWFLLYRVPVEAAAPSPLPGPPSYMSGNVQSGPAPAAVQPDTAIVPPYALQPLSPAVRRGLRGGPTAPAFLGNLVADRVKSLQPTFKWEALPRPALAAPDAGAATPVYELRIFRAFSMPYLGMSWIAPRQEPDVETGGLTTAEFRPTTPLNPCTFYFWTVRARFESGGSRKVTEWSGAYHAGIAPFEPWWERRSYRPPMASGPMTSKWLYFPFQTPDASGKSC